MRLSPAELYGRGVDAADEILKALRVPVGKALNPLDDAQFVASVRRVSNALQNATHPEEAKAAARAAERLTRNWEKLSEAERAKAIQGAIDEIKKAPGRVMPAVDVVLKATAEDMVPETRRQMVALHRLRIRSSTTVRDEKTIETARRVESFFVRDRYGQIATDLSAKARDIVARGLEDGVGSATISEDLQSAMTALERGPAYWDVVAMSISNRARVFTQVHALDDAGFKDFQFSAVMDEVTSRICRYMNGRIFHVAAASKRIARVIDSEPEDIVDILPWVKEARNQDGKKVMYYEDAAGTRHAIATVLKDARGLKDEAGEFSRGLQEGALERAGITFPPLHGRCRSTIIPA